MKSIVPLLIFASMSIFATCNKRLDCIQNNYSFLMNVSASPDVEAINIRDTIWLTIDEPATLKDANTSNSIDYSGAANLGSVIGFQEIIGTTPMIKNVANDFAFKLIHGREVPNPNTELFREFLFKEQNGRYLFSLGVVPKRTGAFRLHLGNAANVYRFNDDCTKASVSFDFKNTNQHFNLYPNGSGTSPGGQTYYFEVK